MGCSSSHGPKYPCAPNNTTNINPATTGDTENGRSMSVIKIDLPRNSNLATAHAATTPKIVFNGTVMAATISVSRIAAHESLFASAAQYAAKPFWNACAKTLTSGSSKKTRRNINAMTMSVHFTNGPSPVPRCDFAWPAPNFLFTLPAILIFGVGNNQTSAVLFSLTPALSLGERENRIPSHAKTCDWICHTRVGKT